ncbi:MAG: GNAT family N-acetyltransferase [Nocardioides sp.]|uniref:GNAT family N-acetyltransferase n=1 Tax=Nocardioides sp. TaxID=35761 RepID=UPI003F0EAFDB
MSTDPRVRPATVEDVPAILRLVHALAVYEKEPDAVEAGEDHFRQALFPTEGPAGAFCHVAEVDGRVVGIAVWFLSFSTWTGRHGIWLEDLFVLPEQRGSGLGKALLQRLAQICVERGYTRLEWWVLDWNAPSIAFYEALGAVAQDEWTTFRLDGAALSNLGA